ncbi:MAG: tRNA (guanosine(46)-N7)-methyltransferase TrmB [Epsilonproteobacteria bacterium]|nr:tRNA (guanosine(46)-N7)-methyltransferase TrmB [Campylobacterota bacterium]
MPHIKVKKFNIERLRELDFIDFLAKDIKRDDLYMAGVDYKKEKFLLEIKSKDNLILIKPEKVSRINDSEIIKELLGEIATKLDLDIVGANINLYPNRVKKAREYLKDIRYFYNIEDIAKDFEKVCLEIGFGSGRHILYQAKKNPNNLYIGIEIHTPSIEQLLKQININRLKNILVVNYDARLLLEILPSNFLDIIYLHFPVPWDKKPHRRVINQHFLKESFRVLKKDSYLELRSDSKNYYYYSLQEADKFRDFRVSIFKNLSLEVISKYEARWRRENKDIYTIYFYSIEDSLPKSRDFDFTFNILVNKEKIISLKKEPFVFEDFFLHFKRVFEMIDGSGFLIELSFGDFNRPEHKFLIIKDKEVSYFPTEPVKINSSYLAHQKIKEVLQ